MAKRIQISISKAVQVKAEMAADNPLNTMMSESADSLHGRATSEATLHGSFTESSEQPDSIHGRNVPQTDAAEIHVLSIHGRVIVPIPTGQTVSQIEIQRGEDGDLTIIVHE